MGSLNLRRRALSRRGLSSFRGLAALLAAGVVGNVSVARAQSPDREAGPLRLPAFGRSVASGDDTSALVLNPANLAFMPAQELRWTGSYLDRKAAVPWQGHALALGFPLPFVPVSTGVRVDLLDPGNRTQAGPRDPYQWLTWGLAVHASESAALGVSLQRTYSSDDQWHKLSSWSVGATVRPWNAVSMAAVVHDVSAPENRYGGFVDRTYDLGVALRPLGTRGIELGAEARWVDAPDPFWVPRGTLGVDVPRFGRVRADLAVNDVSEENGPRSFVASAGLVLNLNSTEGSSELGGGFISGDALGDANGSPGNVYSEVAFKGFREPAGTEFPPRRALRFRFEDTPDARDHVALLRELWEIAERDDRVDAVVLELKTSPVASFAHAQELRDAVRLLRLRGKRVLCHLEDEGGPALYVCAAANRILLNPAGGLRLSGLRTRRFFYGKVLENIGIDADFVRIGAHKSAPEAFERSNATDTARADSIDLLQQYERYLSGALASSRGLTVEQVRERMARGPFIASEAIEAGFADGVAFQDQIEEEAGKLVGRPVELVDAEDRASTAPRRFSDGPSIALIYAAGDIVDGRSRSVPLVGMETLGSYTLAETLERVRRSESVKAVVLRIDSPGGSALGSDVVWREVQLTAKEKPVIVSMATVAASGGYYIATPATRIFASPLTITGSIGIFYGKADVSRLMSKIGLNLETYKTAPRADGESIFRPFTPEERTELERKVGQFYDQFLTRVAEGRKLSKAAVDAVGQGHVWTGEQASARGLVDELGGLRQALAYARKAAGLPEHAPIIELPEVETTLLGRILGVEGMGSQTSMKHLLPAELQKVAAALGPFLIYEPDVPLALLDTVELRP